MKVLFRRFDAVLLEHGPEHLQFVRSQREGLVEGLLEDVEDPPSLGLFGCRRRGREEALPEFHPAVLDPGGVLQVPCEVRLKVLLPLEGRGGVAPSVIAVSTGLGGGAGNALKGLPLLASTSTSSDVGSAHLGFRVAFSVQTAWLASPPEWSRGSPMVIGEVHDGLIGS